MLPDLMKSRAVGRYLAVFFALALAGLLPQAGLCASARRTTPLNVSTQPLQAAQGEVPASTQGIKHVLLLTIDGAHAFDIVNYINSHPDSALAKLKATGVFYKNAHTSIPSDSFPGFLAMITGGGPTITGVWYEITYHRDLSPAGSDCKKMGTEVDLDETDDINSHDLWGGGGFVESKLPLNPKNNCSPVYPHQLLRVNTIFDVIKQAGMYTAYSDKQLGDRIEQGPTGHAIDDFYTPENASLAHTMAAVEHFDDFRTQAVLNWINGKNGKGTESIPVPGIMGVTLQAVAQGEKMKAGFGWVNASGKPSATLEQAFDSVDGNIGKMVDALKNANLLDSTAIIIGAKHGQAPINVKQLRKISPKVMTDAINAVSPGLVAFGTGDDIYMFWLSDQSKTAEAVKALEGVTAQAHIRRIFSGTALSTMFDNPKTDPETPDIIVEPELGVIYTKPTNPTIAEHGGFSIEDTHVSILISNPRFQEKTVEANVQNEQIAPTVLELLGLDPNALEAVRINKTAVLPGLFN